jgi:hypothetical protein
MRRDVAHNRCNASDVTHNAVTKTMLSRSRLVFLLLPPDAAASLLHTFSNIMHDRQLDAPADPLRVPSHTVLD